MAIQAKAKPATRPRLSRERVVRAAVEIADEHGVEGLSMRRLAQQLGVEAMSLYHWFPKKDDIFSGMLEQVYDEIEKPPDADDWRSALRRSAVSSYRVLLRHPWACELLTSSGSTSVNRLQWMDAMLARLREAGFTPQLIDLGYHALDAHITGFVLWVVPIRRLEREQPDFAQQFVASHSLAGTPDLAAHIDYHLAPQPNPVSAFEIGLDLILDGLERALGGSA